MTNRWRGEVALTIDGKLHQMRLTLGALAELEEDLDASTLLELVERFESGRFSARDILALLHAGLRGGGYQTDPDALAQAHIEGGPVAASRAAAELLARAFAVPQ
ncbi:gene transfer agent family protein [Sulfitobacter sp. HNIBRBA3233]|uniref:gene transfer agent family protein n=1 Tax=Sulfitobacter marinivivus TaxID=3158558 RepID=UPI0032DE95B2